MNRALILFFLFLYNAASAQWIQQFSGINCYYRSIQFSDAKTGVAVGNGGTIARTTDGGKSWISNSVKYGHTLHSVCHEDANTIYTSGDRGFLLRSTNQGSSWDTIHLPIPGIGKYDPNADVYPLLGICFVHGPSSSNGFITGAIRNYTTKTETGLLLTTSDGGNSWALHPQNFPAALNGIDFFDDNHGTLVGEKGLIYTTTDAGATWIQQTSGTTQSLRSVDYADSTTAFAAGGNGGSLILKTTDKGITWVTQTVNSNLYLTSVKFADKNTGCAVGAIGTIAQTNNGGLTWKVISVGKENLSAITISPSGAKYATGENGMMYYHK